MGVFSEHIDWLCRKHEITIDSHSRGGRAFRKQKHINIRPVKTSVTYAVALHEIGHVVGPQSGCRMNKEIQAWKWAKDNALAWIEPMENKRLKSLNSYKVWAERHKTATVVYFD